MRLLLHKKTPSRKCPINLPVNERIGLPSRYFYSHWATANFEPFYNMTPSKNYSTCEKTSSGNCHINFLYTCRFIAIPEGQPNIVPPPNITWISRVSRMVLSLRNFLTWESVGHNLPDLSNSWSWSSLESNPIRAQFHSAAKHQNLLSIKFLP